MQKVVIVDDTRANGMLLEGFIKSLPSVAAYTFTRPLEALVWCDDHTPDLVLLDYVMPDIDGIEVATQLSAAGDRPAIVLTSTRDESDFGPQVEESGARGFVPKDELSAERITSLCE